MNVQNPPKNIVPSEKSGVKTQRKDATSKDDTHTCVPFVNRALKPPLGFLLADMFEILFGPPISQEYPLNLSI